MSPLDSGVSAGDKVRLIEALGETGLRHIQACSFVSPRVVPQWSDAEDVVRQFRPRTGITYTGLWFNGSGLERALAIARSVR